MIDSLVEFTSLPNLHPALVHFPIAFFPLALAFEMAGLVLRRQRWLAPAATTLYGLSALSAWLAVWAGQRGADGLIAVPAQVQPQIGNHSDWAHYALYGIAVIAALRIVVHFHPRWTEHRGIRAALVIPGLIVLGVLVKAADLGGGLVFEHGIGVQSATEEAAEGTTGDSQAPLEGPATRAEDRLIRGDDGSLLWRPEPGDQKALGAVLMAPDGSDFDTVRWIEADQPAGLTLRVDGPATLLLPGTFGDVQVEAKIDIREFEGTVGVVHHVQDGGDRGAFTVSAQGVGSLIDIRAGNSKRLDQQQLNLPSGTFVLAVSAAGRHLRGLLDGATVVHGHTGSSSDGRCGLQLEGSGVLRLLEVRVTPLGEGH